MPIDDDESRPLCAVAVPNCAARAGIEDRPMTTRKGKDERRLPSLQLMLSVLCGAIGILLAMVTGFALFEATSLRNDLNRLDEEAHKLLYTERSAAATWLHFSEGLSRFDGAQEKANETEAFAGALQQARPWLPKAQWAALDELLRASPSTMRRGMAQAARGEVEAARKALVEELQQLSARRLEEPLAEARSRGSRRLEDLAALASRAANHPLLRAAGSNDLPTRGLPAYHQSIVAARLIEALRLEQWQHASGQRLHSGMSANLSLELDRLGAGHDLAQLHARFTSSALDADREALITRADSIVAASWPRGAEILSDLISMANLQITVLGLIALVGGFACATVSLLVSRTLFAPLEYLSTRLRLARTNAHTPTLEGGEIDTRWSELREIENAFVQTTSELEVSQRERHNLAFYDGVTGLANRSFFNERLESTLVAARLENWSVALISMGIEGIRQAGDTLGEAASQAVLRETAERLCEVVRLNDFVGAGLRSGSLPASVSRSGDADFSLLLSNVDSAGTTARIAERIVAAMQKPFEIEGRELRVQFQLGIAIFPDDARNGTDLLRAARAALEDARSRGSATPYQFFATDMNDSAARNFHLRSRLSGVLERGDLRLHYQPFRCIRTGQVSGAEVLLRWTDAEMGPVPPSEFVELAERNGMIHSIGRWVLEQALMQQQEWIARGYEPVRMAVNVSAVQLSEAGWSASVMAALDKTGGDPTQLELEITETAFLQDSTSALAAFQELDNIGVGIVLDDFGTGYSQLSYLHHYPIQRIKIDRSFIASIGDKKAGAAVTGAILSLAQSLGLKVIAEGIETEEQAAFLTKHGCDEMQGYLVSHALPPEEFERFLVKCKEDDSEPQEEG
jgi:diguanylate cyclase (GGDEF)-like protein